MRRSLPIFAAVLLLAAPAAAQTPPISLPQTPPISPPLLTLTASADALRAPDLVRLTAGVLTNAATAADAMAGNSARMNAVLAALKSAGVAARDVQTTGLSLSPQYRYVAEQPPILTGYQARNAISIRTARLGDAGRLVDAAIKAGANEVQGPEFTLANPDAALDEARAAAVAKGRARAELYARAAGLKLGRIASITEGSAGPEPGPRPLQRMMAAEASAAPPVQPGELSLTAQVTMSFELLGQP